MELMPAAPPRVRRPRVQISDEDVPAYAVRYARGATLAELAGEVGCSIKHMAATLRGAGHVLRPAGRPRRR